MAARLLLRAIPHVSIVISGMLIVFFCIDRVNDAMGFMESDVTKVLILIVSIASIITAALAMVYRARCEDLEEAEK
jgi:hypothetical protein